MSYRHKTGLNALRTLALFAFFAISAAMTVARADPCATVMPQPEGLPGAQSFTYRTASGRDLRIHIFTPESGGGSHAAILFFFGGGWHLGPVDEFTGQAMAARAHGDVAALADYRVSCRDGVSPVEATSDAEAAYAWLVDHAGRLGIDPRRIVLAGASSGGQLAAVTALDAPPDRRPAALVLFNPVLDFMAFAQRVNVAPAQAQLLSPAELPLEHLPPTIIFQGTADRIVTVETARDFCSKATGVGRQCDLVEYPGLNHGFFHIQFPLGTNKISPYEDTLSKMMNFLGRLHLVE